MLVTGYVKTNETLRTFMQKYPMTNDLLLPVASANAFRLRFHRPLHAAQRITTLQINLGLVCKSQELVGYNSLRIFRQLGTSPYRICYIAGMPNFFLKLCLGCLDHPLAIDFLRRH